MNQLPGCLFAYPPRSECRDAVKIIGPKLYDTQFGFRRDRSTSEQISTLQQIFKKSLEHAKDVDTCFVDLGKVYDLVPCEKLWGASREYGVDGCLLLAVK